MLVELRTHLHEWLMAAQSYCQSKNDQKGLGSQSRIILHNHLIQSEKMQMRTKPTCSDQNQKMIEEGLGI